MQNKKILILGNGYISQRIQQEIGLSFKVSKKRINSFKDAETEIKKYKPNIVINCIGAKGEPNVDGCEDDKDRTLLANTFVPIILAEVCLRNNIKLVHLSTGCFYHYNYGKTKPITETKTPDFHDLFYSRTKNYSERALEALLNKYNILIARPRIPLDNIHHSGNVLTKLTENRLADYENKVIDVPNSVVYVPDFIKALKHLIEVDASGIYNVVNKGGLRYPKLLDVYKKYVPDFKYGIIDYKKLKISRTNLIMSVKKLESTGFKMRHIKDVLEECVREYLKK